MHKARPYSLGFTANERALQVQPYMYTFSHILKLFMALKSTAIYTLLYIYRRHDMHMYVLSSPTFIPSSLSARSDK